MNGVPSLTLSLTETRLLTRICGMNEFGSELLGKTSTMDQPEGKKSNQVFVLLVVTSIGMWEEKEGRGRDTDRESRSQCTGGGAHKSPRIRCIKFVHF